MTSDAYQTARSKIHEYYKGSIGDGLELLKEFTSMGERYYPKLQREVIDLRKEIESLPLDHSNRAHLVYKWSEKSKELIRLTASHMLPSIAKK